MQSIKLLSKYVWSISVKKISFIRACDMEEIKEMGCIIKVPNTSGNIKWRSFALRFCASNLKIAWRPPLPSSKGLSFTFIFYPYTRVMVIITFPFYTFSFGKHFVLERSGYIYISTWMYVFIKCYCWHYPWGKRLGGKTISPYLSLCPINSIPISIAWVSAIVKD